MPEDIWPIDQAVEPGTFGELLDLLRRRDGAHLVYRGQRNFEWLLECTLSRALREQAAQGGPINLELLESMVVDQGSDDHVNEVESNLLRVFTEQAAAMALPELPPSTDRLGWWELMQHHGAPTRLLDWTKSPFVGLWFAFADHRHCDGDAALWIFNTRISWLNHLEDVEATKDPSRDALLDDRDWQNRLADRVIADQSAVVPLVISPRLKVPRVRAQQSVLTLVPRVQAPKAFNHFVLKSFSTRVRLRSEWKPLVLDLCLNEGITRAELFRDLDSIGYALKETLTKNRPFKGLSG